MRKNKKLLILLSVLLGIGLLAGLALGKYTGEWKNTFGLLISPVEQSETDNTLRRYFRSNELLPASENAKYTVHGTSGWFTVANALDKSTVSEDTISYSLTWYVSEDGNTWSEYRRENGSFTKNSYQVAKYTVTPVTIEGVTFNHIKVAGKTSSFLQENIEASYHFTYSNYTTETAYENGVLTIKIDTNDMSGDYQFSWPAGVTPDNSDPNGIFTQALVGPTEVTVTLKHNTDYTFLFFITDKDLQDAASSGTNVISITKK